MPNIAMKRQTARFWAKVDRSGGPDACWPWTGTIEPNGYARYGGRALGTRWAHRIAFHLTFGFLPELLDHTCHDPASCVGGRTCPHRACCNPAHLDPSTSGENTRRGARPKNGNEKKSECPRGHPYDERNTYRYAGRRHCRRCHADRERTRRG